MGVSTRRVAAAMVAGGWALTGLTAAPSALASVGEHCWLDVETAAGGCFDTYEDMLADMSADGTATVLQGGETLVAAPAARGGVTPAASVIIGQAWESANYAGASYSFTASGDCDTNADVDWSLPVMPSGWNDRISSFKSFGLCATKVWENQFTGLSYGFVVNSTYVGDAMNDKTSSIQWN